MAGLFQNDLYNVFRNRVFQIPDYQRGYSWDEIQWKDLIEDLELLPPKRTHFFGTLVLRATGEELQDKEDNKYDVFEIIDGQQRLTTCVIFLSVIHAEMERLSQWFNERPQGLKKNYLYFLDNNSDPSPKLLLNQDCRGYFNTNILNIASGAIPETPEIRSHRLIQQAKKCIEKYLAHWELPWIGHIWWSACKQAIAFQIEEDALKKMLQVE